MDGLSLKILNGSTTALNLVKTLLTTPTLVNKDITQGQLYAIPLDCETYSQDSSAQVSESLLIVKSGKVNVADNVAPGAWSWELSGYIPGTKALEPTNYYTPFVRLNADILKQWYKKGAVLQFKDIDAQPHDRVVIQHLKISHVKDCRNEIPFTMTLKEINVMENSLAEYSEAANNALAAVGSKFGEAKKAGVVMAKTVSIASAGLTTVISALRRM